MREEVFAFIKKEYKASPEYLWKNDDKSAVFRHSDNRKWFALITCVGRDRLGLAGDGCVDLINLKIKDRMFRDMLVQEDGILPAYHMNKEHWVSVLLDKTVSRDRIFDLIDMSFAATASKKSH